MRAGRSVVRALNERVSHSAGRPLLTNPKHQRGRMAPDLRWRLGFVSPMRHPSVRRSSSIAIGLLCLTSWATLGLAASRTERSEGDSKGSELFHHNWRIHDALSLKGDGLGPVYNATSCVACHFQGGSGGAGPARRNVLIATPIQSAVFSPPPADPELTRQLASLVKEKTRLPSAGSVVVHRFGTNPRYASWREYLRRTKFTEFTLRWSERNTPALFGSGLIDAIPDDVLIAAEAHRSPDFPEVKGRVSRLRNGRIGRFGWKGHTERLKDFVLTACSVELGLDVPDHHQSVDPTQPKKPPRGLDLSASECDRLVSYVRSLPAPAAWSSEWPSESNAIDWGRDAFNHLGCSACHVPTLGSVDGLYSDLLLHDMGTNLSDSVAYYETQINDLADQGGSVKAVATVEPVIAASEEWRTPPLWGVRDSAPYLHDGRARTLHAAIVQHGGEATQAVTRYRMLSVDDRKALIVFLMSLAAPGRAKGPIAHHDRLAEEFYAVELGAMKEANRPQQRPVVFGMP